MLNFNFFPASRVANTRCVRSSAFATSQCRFVGVHKWSRVGDVRLGPFLGRGTFGARIAGRLGSSPTAPSERLGTLGAPLRERSEKEGWRLELRKIAHRLSSTFHLLSLLDNGSPELPSSACLNVLSTTPRTTCEPCSCIWTPC